MAGAIIPAPTTDTPIPEKAPELLMEMVAFRPCLGMRFWIIYFLILS